MKANLCFVEKIVTFSVKDQLTCAFQRVENVLRGKCIGPLGTGSQRRCKSKALEDVSRRELIALKEDYIPMVKELEEFG